MPGKGFWKRPITRTYAYNLEVGEHYYNPISSYIDSGSDRSGRGETPGALTYSERLARRWVSGRRYEASSEATAARSMARSASVARSTSVAMDSEAISARRGKRASSVAPISDVNPNHVTAYAGYKQAIVDSARRNYMDYEASRQEARAASASRQVMEAEIKQQRVEAKRVEAQQKIEQRSKVEVAQKQEQMRMQQASSVAVSRQEAQQVRQQISQHQSVTQSSSRRVDDDILKKVVDVHMQPWSAGAELKEAEAASIRSRTRLADLERELEEITRKAMTTQTRAIKTAKQLATEAMMEDQAMASSYKKTKKVMIESSAKVGAA